MSTNLDQIPDFLGLLGKGTLEIILPLFLLFKDENLAPALASSILGFALILLFWFLGKTSFIRYQLWRRTNAIRQIKDKGKFAEALQNIEPMMLSSSHLHHSWLAFRETLLEPLPEDTIKVVRSTARPHAYFNMTDAGLRFGVFRAMPNLLVGVGLLLTFIGLVSALFFTTEAIKEAGDLSASQSALRDLLHAASFKFYTSIAGLGGSIILTLGLRYGTSAIERSFDHLALALERNVVFVTTEAIAYQHYREAQEQTRNLKLFNTEIAISVGKRIEEALAATLPGYLANAIAPIGKSLDDVASKLTSMNEGAIGELAGNFVTRLQGATGEQMQALAGTLGDLRASLDGINHRMNESGSGLADSVSKSSQEMRDAITAMTTALSEVTTKAERGLEDGRSAIKSQVEAAVASLDATARRIAEVLDQTTNRMTMGSEQAGANFTAELAKAAETFQLASGRTASRIEEAVSSISEAARNAGDRVADDTREIGGKIAAKAQAAGEEARATIAAAGQDLASTLAGTSEELTQAISKMQASLEGAVREINNTERSIASHVGSMVQLSKTTQDTESAMAGTARSMRDAGMEGGR